MNSLGVVDARTSLHHSRSGFVIKLSPSRNACPRVRAFAFLCRLVVDKNVEAWIRFTGEEQAIGAFNWSRRKLNLGLVENKAESCCLSSMIECGVDVIPSAESRDSCILDPIFYDKLLREKRRL